MGKNRKNAEEHDFFPSSFSEQDLIKLQNRVNEIFGEVDNEVLLEIIRLNDKASIPSKLTSIMLPIGAKLAKLHNSVLSENKSKFKLFQESLKPYLEKNGNILVNDVEEFFQWYTMDKLPFYIEQKFYRSISEKHIIEYSIDKQNFLKSSYQYYWDYLADKVLKVIFLNSPNKESNNNSLSSRKINGGHTIKPLSLIKLFKEPAKAELLIPKLKEIYKGKKPLAFFCLLYALAEVGFIKEIDYEKISKKDYHSCLEDTFGNVGTYSNFTVHTTVTSSQPYFEEKVKEHINFILPLLES